MFGRVLFLVLLCHLADAAFLCSEICEEGQYCERNECKPCPEGSYQAEPIHWQTHCNQWTSKPPESNYVIARNGSSISDIVWECRDGYYVHSEVKCMKKVVTLLNISTTISTTSRISTVTTTTIASGNNINTISISIVVLVLVIIFAVVMGIIRCRRKSVLYFAKDRNKPSDSAQTHESEAEFLEVKSSVYDTAGDEGELHSKTSNKLHTQINFRFFYLIIERLGVHETEKFLTILDDPSGTFKVHSAISFHRAKHHDAQNYLTHTCLEWVTKNPKIIDHKKCVQKALEDIGRHHVLLEIEESERLVETKLTEMHAPTDNQSLRNDFKASQDVYVRIFQTNGRLESRADRFKTYSHLAERLGCLDAVALMYQLPNTNQHFNAKNFYEQKRNFENEGFQLAFAHTLEEWHLRNPDFVMTDYVTSILKDMNRSDVTQDKEFEHLLLD